MHSDVKRKFWNVECASPIWSKMVHSRHILLYVGDIEGRNYWRWITIPIILEGGFSRNQSKIISRPVLSVVTACF
jgi:hypothetical protein